MDNTLLLVDGSSYLYRAFHALPDLLPLSFFDSIMPPTASAATVTTRFSIFTSLSQAFSCIHKSGPCPSRGWTDEEPICRQNYVKSEHHGAREPCGNIFELLRYCIYNQ